MCHAEGDDVGQVHGDATHVNLIVNEVSNEINDIKEEEVFVRRRYVSNTLFLRLSLD